MKISKKSQNQKKSVSRKQRGASNPDRVIREFNVYYNYILSNFENRDGRNGDLLTRPLIPYELNVCQEWMTDTRDVIIEDGREHDFAALEVGVITQLLIPHNGKYFRINFTVTNKSDPEARQLIREYMEEVYGGGFIEFDNANDDQNRYFSTPGAQVDIENFFSGGYRKQRSQSKNVSRKQRGARPPK